MIYGAEPLASNRYYENRIPDRTNVYVYGEIGLMKDCYIITDRNDDYQRGDLPDGKEEYSAYTRSNGIAEFMFGRRLGYRSIWNEDQQPSEENPEDEDGSDEDDDFYFNENYQWEKPIYGTPQVNGTQWENTYAESLGINASLATTTDTTWYGTRFAFDPKATENNEYCGTSTSGGYKVSTDDLMRSNYGPNMVMDQWTTIGEGLYDNLRAYILADRNIPGFLEVDPTETCWDWHGWANGNTTCPTTSLEAEIECPAENAPDTTLGYYTKGRGFNIGDNSTEIYYACCKCNTTTRMEYNWTIEYTSYAAMYHAEVRNMTKELNDEAYDIEHPVRVLESILPAVAQILSNYRKGITLHWREALNFNAEKQSPVFFNYYSEEAKEYLPFGWTDAPSQFYTKTAERDIDYLLRISSVRDIVQSALSIEFVQNETINYQNSSLQSEISVDQYIADKAQFEANIDLPFTKKSSYPTSDSSDVPQDRETVWFEMVKATQQFVLERNIETTLMAASTLATIVAPGVTLLTRRRQVQDLLSSVDASASDGGYLSVENFIQNFEVDGDVEDEEIGNVTTTSMISAIASLLISGQETKMEYIAMAADFFIRDMYQIFADYVNADVLVYQSLTNIEKLRFLSGSSFNTLLREAVKFSHGQIAMTRMELANCMALAKTEFEGPNTVPASAVCNSIVQLANATNTVEQVFANTVPVVSHPDAVLVNSTTGGDAYYVVDLGTFASGNKFEAQLTNFSIALFEDDGRVIVEQRRIDATRLPLFGVYAAITGDAGINSTFYGLPSLSDVGGYELGFAAIDGDGRYVQLAYRFNISGQDDVFTECGTSFENEINNFMIEASMSATSIRSTPVNRWRETMYDAVSTAISSSYITIWPSSLLLVGLSTELASDIRYSLVDGWEDPFGFVNATSIDYNDTVTATFTLKCADIGGRGAQEFYAEAVTPLLDAVSTFKEVVVVPERTTGMAPGGSVSKPSLSTSGMLVWLPPSEPNVVRQYVISLCGTFYATVPGTLHSLQLKGARSMVCEVDIVAENIYGSIEYPTLTNSKTELDSVTMTVVSGTGSFDYQVTVNRPAVADRELEVVVRVFDVNSVRNYEEVAGFTIGASETSGSAFFLTDVNIQYQVSVYGLDAGMKTWTITPNQRLFYTSLWTFTGANTKSCNVDCGTGTRLIEAVCSENKFDCGAVPPRKRESCSGAIASVCDPSALGFTDYTAPVKPDECTCDQTHYHRQPWCSLSNADERLGSCLKISNAHHNIRALTGYAQTVASPSSVADYVQSAVYNDCDFWCLKVADTRAQRSWCVAQDDDLDDWVCSFNDFAAAAEDFERMRVHGVVPDELYVALENYKLAGDVNHKVVFDTTSLSSED